MRSGWWGWLVKLRFVLLEGRFCSPENRWFGRAGEECPEGFGEVVDDLALAFYHGGVGLLFGGWVMDDGGWEEWEEWEGWEEWELGGGYCKTSLVSA
jgi:hypothetical protein